MPKLAYPFPGNATLVRGGLVKGDDPNTVSVDKAKIRAIKVSNGSELAKAVTDKKGEFVLYFKKIKEEEIVFKIKKDGSARTTTDRKTVKEGEITSAGNISFSH